MATLSGTQTNLDQMVSDASSWAKRLMQIGLIALVGVIMLSSGFTMIGAGQVGVITRFGAVQRVAQPGLTLKIPLVESVAVMETRTQKEQVVAAAASKDLQSVTSTIALNFHLQGDRAVDVYQDIGVGYKERLIEPAMQEAFKATTAQFTASDLIGKREAVKNLAYTELKKRLGKYHITVDDFNIVNFDFSAEFNQAIEQKTVAQQNKERAVIEKETALIQAEGQAQAQARLKESGSLSPEYLQFLAVQKWDGKLPSATSGTPFLNIPQR